jgi:subtilisin family serine protease
MSIATAAVLTMSVLPATGSPARAGQRSNREHGKLASDLHDDAGLPAPLVGNIPNGFAPNSTAPRDARNRVHVLVSGPDTEHLRQSVQANGGSVSSAASGRVDAHVPADRLAALSDDPSVTFVQDGQQYRNNVGTITSEGLANTNASSWIPTGRNGAGVNVAIIDVGGFQGFFTELGDELPATVTTRNFCGSDPEFVDDLFTVDPHGTEVAAIVHDIAPAAGIVLICARNDLQIFQAQNYILQLNSDSTPTNDVSIVTASWGSPIEGRGDGTGNQFTAEGIVRTLRQHGVLWVGSSGNDGAVHYFFTPAGPDGSDLGFGPRVAWAPGNYDDSFVVASGQTVNVLVKWDSWSGQPQDFDLAILDSNGVVVSGSANDQLQGAPPVEVASVTNFTATTLTFRAAIGRFAASANPRFDTYVEFASSELVNPVGSVTIPATSPDALAVGAACVSNNSLEPFSGRGPTIDGRVKPDLTGPDGTTGQVSDSITPYGPSNPSCTSGFTGTSASAPHVAGAAALLKSTNLGLGPTQLQQQLAGFAVDAGPPGADNQFGAGRVRLPTMLLGGPGAAAPSGSTQVFVRGGDGHLWQRTADGVWHPLGGLLTSDPDVAVQANQVSVFARGSDNALWFLVSVNGGASFGTWQPLGGVLGSAPGAVSWGANRIDVFASGADGALWANAFTGSGWSGWYTLGGLVSEPDVATTAVNHLDVFVRGSDNGLWHRVWNGIAWSGWSTLGGGLSSGPTAVSPGNGDIDVFTRGADLAVWSRHWNGSSWGSWFVLGGALVGAPDVASQAVGQLDLVGTGVDAAIWHKTRNAAGTWFPSASGWLAVGKPA